MKKWTMAVCAVSVIAIAIPFPVTVAPEWKVFVVDEKEKPLAKVSVREHWQQYSVDDKGNEETKFTDDSGVVTFPKKTIRASFFVRTLGCFDQFSKYGAHASCGAHSHVFAFAQNYGTLSYKDSLNSTYNGFGWGAMDTRLTLHRCPDGHSGVGCLMEDWMMKPLGTPDQ